MNEELKPCPFCGSEAHVYFEMGECGNKDEYYIECTNDDCCAGLCHYKTEKEAIEQWNKRV